MMLLSRVDDVEQILWLVWFRELSMLDPKWPNQFLCSTTFCSELRYLPLRHYQDFCLQWLVATYVRKIMTYFKPWSCALWLSQSSCAVRHYMTWVCGISRYQKYLWNFSTPSSQSNQLPTPCSTAKDERRREKTWYCLHSHLGIHSIEWRGELFIPDEILQRGEFTNIAKTIMRGEFLTIIRIGVDVVFTVLYSSYVGERMPKAEFVILMPRWNQ